MDLSFFKRAVYLFIARVANPAATVILGLLIARSSVETFGQYSFIVTYCFLFTMVFSLGIGTLVSRDTAKAPQQTANYFKHSSIIGIISGAIGLVIMAATCNFFKMTAQAKAAYLILSISIMPSILVIIWESLLITFEKNFYIVIVQIFEATVRLIIGFKLLFSGYGLTALMTLFLITRFISCGLYFTILISFFRPLTKPLEKVFLVRLLKSTFAFAGLYVFSVLLSKIDMVMLAILRDYEQVGIYSAAYKLLEICILFPTCIITVLFPLLSRYAHTSLERFIGLLHRGIFLSAAVFLPLVIGLCLGAEQIVIRVFTPSFVGSILPFRILIVTLSFYLIDQIYAHSLVACHKQNLNLLALIGATLLNIGINLIMIPSYGAVGAAVSTLISLLFLVVLHGGLVHRLIYHFKAMNMFGWTVVAGLSYLILFIPDVPKMVLFLIAIIVYAAVIGYVWIYVRPTDVKEPTAGLSLVVSKSFKPSFKRSSS
jgi:O-antigen/teichoic acid export membrane protein